MENITVEETKAHETKMQRDAMKADKMKARTARIKSLVELQEAGRRSTVEYGGMKIYVSATQVAKIVAITGAIVVAAAVTVYLVKVGIDWFVKYLNADGSTGVLPLDTDDVDALL